MTPPASGSSSHANKVADCEGRVLRPEQVAAAALFLVSGESSGMTAREPFVDGRASIA